ncbi:MAG: 3-phosphoshikimate 1-carboxyvinyltransferase [Syntrophobacteraceae bacterium]|nr:3-phosphoshikimate 1-carboxyvinyltransferase [Syntrophobacteraceae bacterium]
MGVIIKKIQTVRKVKASIRLPGSKSITHRALLMAALAEGAVEILYPLEAEDTLLTAKALQELGVHISWESDRVLVTPPSHRWSQPRKPIFLGNSGTSMRLLPAVAAAGSGRFIFDGTPRLRERPIAPLVSSLRSLGARIRYLNQDGYPPIEMEASGLQGGETTVDARQSSQFVSALLLASPCAAGDVLVRWEGSAASFPYISLTLAVMEEIGIEYRWSSPTSITVPAPQTYPAFQFQVEGDCSSASYFWAAAALTGGQVHTAPVHPGSAQGDCRFLDVLEEMGCRVQWEAEGVTVTGTERLKPVFRDMNAMPDMVPTLAVLAAFAPGTSVIHNVGHLRVKESDRLHVMATELRKLGVPVEEFPDRLHIEGGAVRPPGAPIEAHNDHRIAMAFAVAGLRAEGIEIHGAESVSKSFPRFWEIFETLGP